MSLLSQVRNGPDFRPPRLVIYGSHGIGKSSLAAHAPAPILIDIEGGSDEIGVSRFPRASRFADVIEQIMTLVREEHQFSTLIIDSIDWLEKLVWEKTASRLKINSVQEMPYGRAFAEAEREWQYLLTGLDAVRDKRGMTVVLLAHSEIRRYDDPSSDPYDRHQISLHKTASALIQEWADAVLFYGWKVTTKSSDAGFGRKITRGKGNGARLIHTQERPSALAKNRFAMPDIIEIPDEPAAAWAELALHIPYFSNRQQNASTQLEHA